MLLKRLYSEPLGLFYSGKEEHPHIINFKVGINFIFGKKEKSGDSKDSLNGIGKSTILSLIDFCLLSDFKRNERVYKERNRINDHLIVLEFKIDNTTYVIKRGVLRNKKVIFGTQENLEEYDLDILKEKLATLLFMRDDYYGEIKKSWYRKLMGFFIKIHKKKSNVFDDPIQYFPPRMANSYELHQYHFFLLGLPNKLLCQNYELQEKTKNIDTVIKKLKSLIEESYDIQDIAKADSEIDQLKNQIKKVEELIKTFQLGKQHHNIEEKLNKFTKEIKELYAINFKLNKQIDSYKASYELTDSLSDRTLKNVSKLYNEINSVLGKKIKKTLADAVDFRKKLSLSRKEFLEDEINLLEQSLEIRYKKIEEIELERQKLFSILDAQEAIKDLAEAYEYKGKLEAKASKLDSNYKSYKQLIKEKQEWQLNNEQIMVHMSSSIDAMEEQITEFKTVFAYIYSLIYPKGNSSGISITQNLNKRNKKNKVSIDITFPDELSKGKNKGRTLVYDLAVMYYSITKNRKLPRFLIHDGIFDGMDKAHFVELYQFAKAVAAEGKILQYIVTINEEGDLKDNFGATDELSTEKIAQEAIAVLTPQKRFWGN